MISAKNPAIRMDAKQLTQAMQVASQKMQAMNTAMVKAANTWGSTTITNGTNNTTITIGPSTQWIGPGYQGGYQWPATVAPTSPPLTPAQQAAMLNAVKYVPTPKYAAPHGFNKYVNGSDLMEEFIRYLGTEGVRKGEMMELPVELFIKWLIIRACEEDKEETDVVLKLPAPKQQPRCLSCRRWMRQAQVLLCGPPCATRYFARNLAA